MVKRRYIFDSFWVNEWVESLTPLERLLFLYLLTNPLTNKDWIYEVSIKRMCFDTWLHFNMIEKMLDKFKNDWKIKYIDWFIHIINKNAV